MNTDRHAPPEDFYTDPATITAASRLGLVAAVLSGVGLALLALGALAGT